MPYDPKRPRRTLDDDAPVEALLTDDLPARSDVQSAARPEVEVPEIEVPEVEAPGIEVLSEDEPVADEEPVRRTDAEPVRRTDAEPVGRTDEEPDRRTAGEPTSAVPVAPAPTEQTANLAVAGATGAAALLTLIILLLLRRRARRNGAG
ncbi:MAG: hypothetical protein KGR17_09560 [Acidobacteria bacterium]|nr:hypothetical protein [Acidobacteriota bacterium]